MKTEEYKFKEFNQRIKNLKIANVKILKSDTLKAKNVKILKTRNYSRDRKNQKKKERLILQMNDKTMIDSNFTCWLHKFH